MQSDQAAGLRRRSARHPVRCIHVFSDTAASSTRLAHALHQHGWTSLLIDAGGRLPADASPRSLFGWRQQLDRETIQTLPMPYGDAWHAPGVQADEPALLAIAARYDCLLVDAGPDASHWLAVPGMEQTLILDVPTGVGAMQSSYAVLKTVSGVGGGIRVGLLGCATVCSHLLDACTRFLDPSFAGAVHSVAHEDDAFAALAVRMASENTGLMARSASENTGLWS